MKRAFAALMLAVVACGGSSAPATFVYRDQRCGSASDGGSCQEVGDGQSYQECSSDSQCPGSAPYCRSLGLYSGGDFNCNGAVVICRTANHDDCPRD
jgi:hypothetical protein